MDSKKLSLLSIIAASSCCLPPLILLGLTLVGISTANFVGLSSTLGSLKWYILPLAIVGLGLSYWLYFREKKNCSSRSCKMAYEKLTKTMLTISTIVVFGFLSWSVYPFFIENAPVPQLSEASSLHLAVYSIDGMTCGGCEIAVDEAIEATGLVDSAKSSFINGEAYIWYADNKIDFTKLEDAIRAVGYTGKLISIK